MSTEPVTGYGSALTNTEANGTTTGGTGTGSTEASDGGASGGGSWAPDSCTLPDSERPLRAADFDAVFAATVRDLDRVGPTRLRLDLEPSPQAAARMAELAAAETGCCSFFTFALTATGGALTLDITVPQQYAPVLDALADRAAAARRAS